MLLVRKTFDVPFTFLCLNTYLLFIPAFFHLIGVHTDIIDRFFVHTGDAFMLQGIILAVYYVTIALGFLVFYANGTFKGMFPDYRAPRSDFMAVIGITVIAVITLSVALIPFFMAGQDIFSTIDLIRNQSFFSGFSFLIQIPLVGLFIISAYLLDLIGRKRAGRNIPNGLISYVWFIYSLVLLLSFLFGGKGIIVFPLAAFVITYFLQVRKQSLVSLALPIVALALLIIGMQAVRVFVVMEAKQDPVEFTYGALGFDLLDGNLLYIDSLGDKHTTNTGQDFYLGALNLVPRSVWEDKPEYIDPGGRFRMEVEQKEGLGAWPVMHFNVWYANFGWIGVCMGGLLSGLILAALAKQYGDCRDNPYSSVFLLMIVFKVTTFGIGHDFLAEYVLWVMPLFIFKWLTSQRLIPYTLSRGYSH